MTTEDRKTMDFLLEQNKELKDALNNQIDKIFSLEEENQDLQDEIDNLRTKEFEYLEKTNRSYSEKLSTIKEAEESIIQKDQQELQEASTQTFEFEDPFEEELIRQSHEDARKSNNYNNTTFKYSLTSFERSTFKSIFDVEDDHKVDGNRGRNKGFEGDGKGNEEVLRLKNEIDDLKKKIFGMTESIMEANKENLRLKKEIRKNGRTKGDIDEVRFEYEGKIEKKDGQISEMKDEIVRISNMINEVTYADIKSLKVKN